MTAMMAAMTTIQLGRDHVMAATYESAEELRNDLRQTFIGHHSFLSLDKLSANAIDNGRQDVDPCASPVV